MTTLFIEALDVWLFRDGRPFSPGSGSRAESLFPPYPTVIQGAVRSKYLTATNVDLFDKNSIAAAVGDPLDYSGQPVNIAGLQINGPFVAVLDEITSKVTRYFPQPADAYSPKNSPPHTIRPASAPVTTPVDVQTSPGESGFLLGYQDEPTKGESGLWLDQDTLVDYLEGKVVMGVPSATLFGSENRIGIGLQDATRTVEEGLLYEVEYTRPARKTGLVIDIAGFTNFPSNGFLQIGGESRAGYFQAVAAPALPPLPKSLPCRFKVYFATPAYFRQGFQPDKWENFFNGGHVKLRVAALNRYESVGGFDWGKNYHRPTMRYVPAGSVYYFECDQNPTLKEDKITDFGAEIGFGQVIITDKEW